MATTTVDRSRRPSVQPASVDINFGGTLAARQIKLTGPELFARDGYLVLGYAPQADRVFAREEWSNVALKGTSGLGRGRCVIIGEKTVASSSNLSAATWARAYQRIE